MCRCPKCNTELKLTDVFDTDCTGDDFIVEGYGYCPICNTEYWIDTIYKFSHYKVKEMED